MKKAFLDCVNKKVQFAIGEENFIVNLEGKEVEFGMLRTKLGDYQIKFSWSYAKPQFSIIPDKQYYGELPKGDLNLLLSNWEYYEVTILRGSKEDYFGNVFPNGFVSYVETYGVMMREISYSPEYDRWVSNKGSIYMLEVVRKWAMEFEKNHLDTDWGQEETDWDEQVIEFLTKKLQS